MKAAKLMILIGVASMIFVLASCLISELSWSNRLNAPEPLRQLVGLPSIAVGNLNPAARNPGLEFLCTGLYDIPGGYCYYYSSGVPYVNFTDSNITVSVTR
jgi:hypothetical protein